MKKAIFLLGIVAVASLGSCNRKMCPAYGQNSLKKASNSSVRPA
jgi:hypothetical protein